MNSVNELLQNIRFLKFYGWGNIIYFCCRRESATDAVVLPEYYWADKVEGTRASELKWRVKENIVDTLISFIWWGFLLTLIIDFC